MILNYSTTHLHFCKGVSTFTRTYRSLFASLSRPLCPTAYVLLPFLPSSIFESILYSKFISFCFTFSLFLLSSFFCSYNYITTQQPPKYLSSFHFFLRFALSVCIYIYIYMYISHSSHFSTSTLQLVEWPLSGKAD